MKKLKLNLKNMGEILNRDQLKQVLGGSGSFDGNIYCNIGGSWRSCSNSDISWCVDACVTLAGIEGTFCGGCTQFPGN